MICFIADRDQKFYLIVNLVRQHSAEELVTKLMSGKAISIDQVVRESEFSHYTDLRCCY